MGKLLQGTFETRKRLFISAFSICVTVPIIFWKEIIKYYTIFIFKINFSNTSIY